MSEPTQAEAQIDIPEGIRRARAALRRDLPALMASWWTRGKWACYGVNGKIGIGKDSLALLKEALRRNTPEGEFIIERIAPGAGSDEEEEIEIHDV